MPSILPKINLATASFTPATFQGNTFTPQQADMSLLARSLDKIEERQEKLANQRLAMSEAFSKARDLLPDNEETNKYITNEQNRINDSINALISAGDYSGALQTSKNLAGQFISSPEFVARKKEHQSRKEWLDNLDRSNVDNYIKEYYKDTYQDRNNFTRDKDGNITGTAGWEAPLPEQGQSASAIIQMAVKATADERTDSGSQWTSETGTGGHNIQKREWLTADRISSTAKSIINNDARVKQAFVDQFNAGIHQINKLEKALVQTTDPVRRAELENQIAGYKQSYYKNGSPMESADAYIDNLFSANNNEIKNASYDYKHSSTGSDNYVRGQGASNGFNLAPGAGGLEGGYDLSAPGQSTQQTSTGNTMPKQGVRPADNKRPTRKSSGYVAPGNNWS